MERIGFIGLGLMGKPMARNLLEAGYPLVVHNRSRAAVEELAAAGARAASSPKEVAEQSDVVITMVPDSPDVEAVVLGPEGVLAGSRPGMLLIDMSTIAPATSRRIAQRAQDAGVAALDAPVSGGDIGAKAGTLTIMVGGSEEAFARARPIFDVLGGTVNRIGEAGAGQVAKACNQVIVALNIQAVSEALLLAARAGVDPARVRAALLGGFASSRVLEVHGERMLERKFEPGFKSHMQRKDLRIALATADECDLPLPATAQVLQVFNALVAQGGGERDHAAIATLLEASAGATIA